MRKFVLSFVMILFLGVNLNAQEITKEEARRYASEFLISFKNTLEADMKQSDSFDDFVRRKTGVANPSAMPSEGKELLKVTYNYHTQGLSDEEIIASYSGIEVAKALKYLQGKPNDAELHLFGMETGEMRSSGKGGPNADYEFVDIFNFKDDLTKKPCRWYQIKCHLDNIVGEDIADILLKWGVELLKNAF